MTLQPIVSPEEWEAARQELLVEEKALMKERDALAAKRRRMPWMAVDKEYRFEGPAGAASLADLFEGRRQLIVYRAFYAPDVTTYPQTGGSYPMRACDGCSFVADQVAHPAHLNARDTTLAFVSRAPQADIRGLKERMGWHLIPWYTLTDDFDADFGVDQMHGTNAFIRDGDRIFRTYFVSDRGDEQMGNTWNYLDITALGRQEEWEDSPQGYPQTPPYLWWNYHDAYGTTPTNGTPQSVTRSASTIQRWGVAVARLQQKSRGTVPAMIGADDRVERRLACGSAVGVDHPVVADDGARSDPRPDRSPCSCHRVSVISAPSAKSGTSHEGATMRRCDGRRSTGRHCLPGWSASTRLIASSVIRVAAPEFSIGLSACIDRTFVGDVGDRDRHDTRHRDRYDSSID